MPSTLRTAGREWGWKLVAAALILFGVWLRVADLPWMQYGGEQEEILVRAFGAIQTHGAPHGLRVSNGIVMPPFFIDLIALPVLFTRDPVHVAAFIVALNLLGLVLFHVFVRRFVGASTALWTSVLLISMPWAVISSRKIWAQDCIFPFTSALLLIVFSNLHEYRRWKSWLGFLVFAAWSQIYPATWFLIPPLLVFAWIFRVRIPLGDLLVGLLIVALSYVRWFGFQLGSGFDDVAWFAHAGHPEREGAIPWIQRVGEALLWPTRATSAAGFEAVAGSAPESRILPPSLAPAFAVLSRVAQWITAAAILFVLAWSATRVKVLRRSGLPAARDPAIVLCALIVLMVVGAYALLALPPVSHYHVTLLPMVALLLVVGLEQASSLVGGARGAWSRPAIAILALANAVFLWRFEVGVREHPRDFSRAYGVPYVDLKDSWRTGLAQGFDEILHGRERRRAQEEALAREFEAADQVLVRVDTEKNEPPITTQGDIAVRPAATGLAVSGSSLFDLLSLPPIDPPDGSRPMLKLELTTPQDTHIVLFYGTREHPGISRDRKESLAVPAGRSTVYVPFQEAGIAGRILMRVEVYRFTIHALEIRALRR